MTTGLQVAVPLVAILLVAGGSLVGWVALFRSAAKAEARESHGPDPSHTGSH